MAEVLIVSKTRMYEGRVCVGGIDVTNNVPLRLHDQDGYHETQESCEYEIRDVWEIVYLPNKRRPLPHSNEDVNVLSKKKKGVLSKEYGIFDVLQKYNFHYNEGNIENIFNRLIKSTENGKMYISHSGVPNHSTCFWVCDKDLFKKEFQKDGKQSIVYKYPHPNYRYGIQIKYVGLEPSIDCIPKGTLIRLSLAHWWKPNDKPDEEERCYLQLSGWY